MIKKEKRIGEILLEEKLITSDILEDALEYQKKFGGNTTQYFLKYGFITEEELAMAISAQFGCPYLTLKSYDISNSIIDLIPAYVAEKYWLIPADKMGDVITVVMTNPCDQRVIKEIEEITHCRVEPFVGVASDIALAIARYYKINVKDKALEKERQIAPLFIRSESYEGLERRKTVKIRIAIPMQFAEQDVYTKTATKDVSRYGLLFESPTMLPQGAFLKVRIDLPGPVSDRPVRAVGQVMRVVALGGQRFDVGVKMVEISKEDADRLISYALKMTLANVSTSP